MLRKFRTNLVLFLVLGGVLVAAHFSGAQDFGAAAVNNGLGGSLSAADPRELAGRIINIILGLLGVIAVGLITYAGFLWMSSGGDEEKVGTAKKILKNGLIGLAIILASWAIATFIITRLSGAGGGSGNYGCTPGSSLSCGCFNSGLMVCAPDGTWGSCVGEDCDNGVGGDPTSCDGNTILPGCQAAAQICSPADYCDASSCDCLPRGGQGDSCDSDPASPTCEADNGRCSEFLTCNPLKDCTCDGPPVITAVSPSGGFCEEDRDQACIENSDCATACNSGTPSGAPDNFITIFGKNFGEYSEDSSQVLFEGGSRPGRQPSELNAACVDTWRDDQIVIAVPAGVLPGAIRVTNNDGLSDSTGDAYGPAIPDFLPSNLNRPGLCFLDPNRGILSSEVGYQGINLFSSQAYFGNYQNSVRALDSEFVIETSGTALTPNINSGDSGSFVQRPAANGLTRSNFLLFTKEAEEGEGPFISSFYPTSGPSEQYVTLRGRGFGGARGASRVYFGETEAAYDFPDVCLNSVWRDNQIIVKVPASISDGYHTIKINIGTTTIDTARLNPNGFSVDQSQALRSSLCKIEPDRGPAATPVTLWGEYFGPVSGLGLAKFNFDKTATGTIEKDGRADMIETSVPAGAISGPVRVINNSAWGNELNFAVGECQADSDCGTQLCCPVGTFKAGRCSQTLAQCFIEIPSSVFEWRFSTGFATSSTSTNPCVGEDCEDPDPCRDLIGFEDCQKSSVCCFDDKTSSCRSGDQIATGDDLGYCAYYNCQVTAYETSGNLGLCASANPVRSGVYGDISSCEYYCANPPVGPGLSCAGYATSTCASDICNFPGFACLLESGALGLMPPACGTCCCQPGTVSPLNPDLDCVANQGACKGASRGLFCGCSRDEECGAQETVGCGSGACCEARPEVTGSLPAHFDDKVCRNAVIRVDFNQRMDPTTFASNLLLLEERDYGNGVCPTGTYVVKDQTAEDMLARKNTSPLVFWLKGLGGRLLASWQRLTGDFSPDGALAVLPDPNKLYCAMPGIASGQNSGELGSLFFTPQRILSPSANYYLVVKGDEGLDSQTGILSASQVGLNGQGYYNVAYMSSGYVEGETISFNGRAYKNSHIIKFTTLSDQGPASGICTIDRVSVSPASYLFSTSENGLNENDTNFNNVTFDTVSDRDKLVTAQAHSAGGQILQPVTGYFWDWRFSLSNSAVATVATGSAITNLPANRALVTARTGVTDGEAKIRAEVNMDRFNAPLCTGGGCSCLGTGCSNNCCNAYLGGDRFNNSGDLYVFICNNPWPPVDASGSWSPWLDNCQGSIGGGCAFYNYKFYYCRDAGAAGTLDDLPAIINQAVIRGASSNLTCSADRTPCPAGSISNTTRCGPDQNGDGQLDGLCIWDVLKESYFFRASTPSAGELLSVTDQMTGGKVKVSWRSDAQLLNGFSQVYSYKIYYLTSGRGAMLFKEVKPADLVGTQTACTLSGGVYNCSSVVGGLSNNVPYVFKVSVISVARAESQLSAEKSVTPTDKTAPAVPRGLGGTVVASTTLRFSWLANTDDAIKYRLYRGVSAGQYGESFDSQSGVTSLSFPVGRFTGEENYFTLSALDAAGNESGKSAEVFCTGSGATIDCVGVPL